MNSSSSCQVASGSYSVLYGTVLPFLVQDLLFGGLPPYILHIVNVLSHGAEKGKFRVQFWSSSRFQMILIFHNPFFWFWFRFWTNSNVWLRGMAQRFIFLPWGSDGCHNCLSVPKWTQWHSRQSEKIVINLCKHIFSGESYHLYETSTFSSPIGLQTLGSKPKPISSAKRHCAAANAPRSMDAHCSMWISQIGQVSSDAGKWNTALDWLLFEAFMQVVFSLKVRPLLQNEENEIILTTEHANSGESKSTVQKLSQLVSQTMQPLGEQGLNLRGTPLRVTTIKARNQLPNRKGSWTNQTGK